MSIAVAALTDTPSTHTVRLGRRRVPVTGPSLHDPRLRLSAVIITLHILGQTVLGFKVSIAQILFTVVLCALIEVALSLLRDAALIWPASGLLTGSSIAFILRASGTRHGDWWSLHGIQYFALAAVISLLSKHLLRPGGKHLFNPSNVGIVSTLLLAGPARVFPQYLWWGDLHAPVLAALTVILLGGLWVLRPVRMYAMAASFLATFTVLVGVFALSGRRFVAVWHSGPVTGMSFWLIIAASPEVLVFAFFMMPDPRTTPSTVRGRVIFGVLTAALAGALLFFQPTEFGIKLAILSSLTFTCALAPVLDGSIRARLRAWQRDARRMGKVLLNPVVVSIVVIALAAPLDTAALSRDTQVILIERGQTGSHNPQ